MSGGGSKRGLTPEQIAEAKSLYEAGHPMAAIARKLNVRRPTLIAARDRATEQGEPWIVQPRVQMTEVEAKAVRERATAQVIDIATRRVVDKMASDGVLDEAAAAIDSILRRQPQLYAKAGDLINATLDRAIAGKLVLGINQGETAAVNDLLSGLSKFTKDGRLVAGLREGTPTLGESSDGNQVRVVWEDVPEAETA